MASASPCRILILTANSFSRADGFSAGHWDQPPSEGTRGEGQHAAQGIRLEARVAMRVRFCGFSALTTDKPGAKGADGQQGEAEHKSIDDKRHETHALQQRHQAPNRQKARYEAEARNDQAVMQR